jgi:hypothetical protein
MTAQPATPTPEVLSEFAKTLTYVFLKDGVVYGNVTYKRGERCSHDGKWDNQLESQGIIGTQAKYEAQEKRLAIAQTRMPDAAAERAHDAEAKAQRQAAAAAAELDRRAADVATAREALTKLERAIKKAQARADVADAEHKAEMTPQTRQAARDTGNDLYRLQRGLPAARDCVSQAEKYLAELEQPANPDATIRQEKMS